MVKSLPGMRETQIQSLGGKDRRKRWCGGENKPGEEMLKRTQGNKCKRVGWMFHHEDWSEA